MLSVVIPCYNCASYIEEHVRTLVTFLSQHFPQFEIVLVDDGSKDETARCIQKLSEQDVRIKALLLASNQGKGAAVKKGILASQGEIIVFTDADLPYDLPTILEFRDTLNNGQTDVVLGTRYKAEDAYIAGQTEHRTTLSSVFVFLANAVLRHPVPDTQAGIKGFTRAAAFSIFPKVTISRFCFDVEVIAIAQKQGFTVASVPAKLVHQGESSVHLLRDGLMMCADLVYIFLKYRLMV